MMSQPVSVEILAEEGIQWYFYLISYAAAGGQGRLKRKSCC